METLFSKKKELNEFHFHKDGEITIDLYNHTTQSYESMELEEEDVKKLYEKLKEYFED